MNVTELPDDELNKHVDQIRRGQCACLRRLQKQLLAEAERRQENAS